MKRARQTSRHDQAPQAYADDRRWQYVVTIDIEDIRCGCGVRCVAYLDLAMTQDTRTLSLPSGRRVEVQARRGQSERLVIKAAEGSVELRVRLTAAGPVLEFSAAAVALRTDGDLSLDCDTLRISARAGIEVETGGDFAQHIAGDQSVVIEGESCFAARHVEFLAREGDLELRAQNDAMLVGKRVFLNP